MKISFQIIHNYQDEPLKKIGIALHLTMQDDLYIEIDLRTVLEFIKINLNKTLNSTDKLCYFEIEIDDSTYDLSNYDEFIEGLTSRLKIETDGSVRVIKFVDELRNIEYQKFYTEITEIEMKLREVFSYIFYNRYASDEVDELNEYVIKLPADPPKKNEIIERFENLFFYFTFNGYKDYFQKPRDIPYDIKELKDLILKIRNMVDYEALTEILEVKGLLISKHKDFILSVKEDLDSIEKLRNCVAHNRTATSRIIDSYKRSKLKLEQQILDFWNEEKTEIYSSEAINFAEKFSYEKINNLLSLADWNENTNKVVLQAEQDSKIFNTLPELKSYLIEIADIEAQANLPTNENERLEFETNYKSEILIEKILNEYKKELIIIDWI